MADRRVMLSYSDDGGRNWSDWQERDLGAIGQYNSRVQFTRLGSFVRRIWRIRITSPIKASLNAGQVNFRQTTR